MKYHPLGRSGLIVSELCLGTMIFGENSPRSTDADTAGKMIQYYLEQGGNHIDTANTYAEGRSEEIVGQFFEGKRQEVVLATKLRFSIGKSVNDAGLSRSYLIKGVEISLKRLRTDYIDILYVHLWDPITPLEETMRALDDLVAAGKIRYIGVSNFKAWQLMKALSISDQHGWSRFIAAQYQYSLVCRDIEREFVELCVREGVGITPWGPLGGGFLTGKYHKEHRPMEAEDGRLATQSEEAEEAWNRRNTPRNWHILEAVVEIAENHPGASNSQIALAWLLHKPGVVSVVLGARTLDQLRDNMWAPDINLNPKEMQRLEEISAIDPGYPYRMIQAYGSRKLQR
jgi:aryl-alcohol dehydrogenase-like predicted oxidoreductase